jgi:hypothetical protein
MRKLKHVGALLLVAITIVTLVGCHGASSQSAPSPSPTTPAARALPLPAGFAPVGNRVRPVPVSEMSRSTGGYLDTGALAVKQTSRGHYQWLVSRSATVQIDPQDQSLILILRNPPNKNQIPGPLPDYQFDARAACALMSHRDFPVLTRVSPAQWALVSSINPSQDTCSAPA